MSLYFRVGSRERERERRERERCNIVTGSILPSKILLLMLVFGGCADAGGAIGGGMLCW